MQQSAILAALVALSVACASDTPMAPGGAESKYTVGDRLTPLSLEDQHGESAAIGARTRLVLFSRDMDGGDVIKPVLEPLGDDYLERNAGVYIADISGMPALIARMMAIPRMRDRSYRTLLDKDGTLTARIPGEPGYATVLRLDELLITDLRFVESADDLRSYLDR